MRLKVTRAGAVHTGHRLHFFFHSLYLTAATLEGHLLYSVAAGATLLFMVGTELLDHDAA